MRKVLLSESPKSHFNLRPNLSYPRCPDSRLCSLYPMLGIFSWRHNLDFSRVFVQRLQHLLSVLLRLGESNVELFLAHFLPVQRPRKVLEPGRYLLSPHHHYGGLPSFWHSQCSPFKLTILKNLAAAGDKLLGWSTKSFQGLNVKKE